MNKPTKPYKCELHGEDRAVVREVPTNQIVGAYDHPWQARQVANYLNGGSGFNGYTPPFFLNKLAVA